MPVIRTLIAEDHPEWRRQIGLLLLPRSEWEIIAEATDGSETLQKAEELKPDLIVLDIGLPKLNGIEAARRIRQISPNSKIVFLSQNRDPDIVRAALGTGALGYVLKTDAHTELLAAIDTILRGQRFVSSSLSGSEFPDSSGDKAPHRHEVFFHSDETVLLDNFARFVADALKTGDAAIAIILKSHRDSFLQRLKIEGVDTDGALRRGTYIQLDVAEMFSTFMVNDMPDPVRFFEVANGVIKGAMKATQREHPRVVACGEGAPSLLSKGKIEAAIRVEQLWDELVATFKMDTLCGYAMSSFPAEKDEHIFQTICAQHSAVHIC